MNRSTEINEIAKALSVAQANLKPAAKGRENAAYKLGGKNSTYADLPSVMESCRKVLSDAGIAIVQATDFQADETWLETMLAHTSGQWVSGRYPIRPVKNDPQGMMSALTYARRGGLMAIVGVVADDDDDGNAASGKHPEMNGKASEPQGTITRDQCDTLLGLVKAAGKDVARMCEYYKIPSLMDLPAKEYVHATAMMKSAANKNEAKP